MQWKKWRNWQRATSQDIIALAQTEIGYKETPPNSNKTKYGEWYGLNGQPWCVIFLEWCFRNTKLLKKTSSTSDLARWFMSKGRFTSIPQEGDLVIFNFRRPKGAIGDHIGMVEKVLVNGVQTIEGNTSTTVVGSQSNGGCVARRTRTKPAQIVGYCRPEYTNAKTIARPTLKKGSKGADVYQLQTLLNLHGAKLTVDGDFGNNTLNALKKFQETVGIAVDGVCGNQSWSLLT